MTYASRTAPFISVVVPTFNGRSTLGRALTSVRLQNYPTDRFEVIVVDDGSTQDIASLAEAFGVRFVRLPRNRGVAAARNAGLEIARGELVVGLDDDCVAEPDWLVRLTEAFEDDAVVGSSGVLIRIGRPAGLAAGYLSSKEVGPPPPVSSNPGNSIVRRLRSYLNANQQTGPATTGTHDVAEIYGCNAVFRAHVLRSVGGWDETMSGIEDTDLCRRIALAHPASRFVSVRSAKVAHEPHMNLSRLLVRAVSRGPVMLRFYRRNGYIPPVFPSPLVCLTAVVALAFRSVLAAAVTAIVLPQALYFWWGLRAWSNRSFVPLLFPYLQLLEETAIVAGLLRGYAQTRSRPSTGQAYSPAWSWLSRTLSRRLIGVTGAERRAGQTGDDVWLTFDDGGSPEQVECILATLAEYRVRAMFFLVGDWAQANPGLVAAIREAGHVLGNHTYSHRDLLTLDESDREQELALGVQGSLLRPPMGRYDRSIRTLAGRHGMQIAYWSVDSDDWQGVGEDYIFEKVMHEVRPGSVILFHLHAGNTVAVLPRLIAAMRSRHLVLAPVPAPITTTSVREPVRRGPGALPAGAERLRALFRRLAEDSFSRNAGFLVASTGIMSILGFLFWVFVARLYPTADIGIASAVISISVLTSNISMVGLNVSLIRFLPNSRTPNGDINAALIVVGTVTVLVSAGYAAVGTALSSKLPFFTEGTSRTLLFCALLAFVAMNSLTDSVFIARRRAHYHTIAYTVFGSVRLVLALVLVREGSLGIFLAYTAAGGVALLLSLWCMNRGCGYRFWTRPNFGLLVRARTFSTNNYLGLLLSGLPSQVTPSLIVAELGGSSAAYFAMATTIANLLAIVPMAVEQSLLAEGANDNLLRQPPDSGRGRRSARRSRYGQAARMLYAVMVPTVLVVVVAAPHLLRVFGAEFSSGSTRILQLLAISTLFAGTTNLCTSMLNVQQRTGWITAIQGLTAAVTLTATYLLIRMGLPGVGIAFVSGSACGALTHLAVQWSYSRRRAGSINPERS